jgi:hypothetical protein
VEVNTLFHFYTLSSCAVRNLLWIVHRAQEVLPLLLMSIWNIYKTEEASVLFIYLTTLTVTNFIWRRMIGWYWMILGKDVEESGRGLTWNDIPSRAWRKPGKSSVMIVGRAAEFWAALIPNTGHWHYFLEWSSVSEWAPAPLWKRHMIV